MNLLKKGFLKILFCLIVILSAFSFFKVKSSFAYGNLYLTNLSGSVQKGNVISVDVRLNTNGTVINAASAYIDYPTDVFDIVWIDNQASIFTVWAEKYADNGLVKISGGLLPPGFNGDGLIATIGLKVKELGDFKLGIDEKSHIVTESGNYDIFDADLSQGLTYTIPLSSSTNSGTNSFFTDLIDQIRSILNV